MLTDTFLFILAKTFVLRDAADLFVFGFIVLTTVPPRKLCGKRWQFKVGILANVNDGI